MISRFFLALALLCTAAPAAAASDAVAVRALNGQVAAWNRGDLQAALDAYCPSEGITWVTRQGVSRGFAEFAAAMRSDFKDPRQMGIYQAEILEQRSLGRSALLVVKWAITREGKRLMGGVSTQLWQPCRGRLRVVLEHAS